MIHDMLSHWNLYFRAEPWRRVFEYLASLDANAEEGRFALQGDAIYAIVMSYDTIGPEQAVLETHDHYIDIQRSLVNTEAIDWYPRAALEVLTPYDADKDRTFYRRPDGPCTRIENSPGRFTVLFQQDAHMPMQASGGITARVKKVVVKLHRSTLEP